MESSRQERLCRYDDGEYEPWKPEGKQLNSKVGSTEDEIRGREGVEPRQGREEHPGMQRRQSNRAQAGEKREIDGDSKFSRKGQFEIRSQEAEQWLGRVLPLAHGI